MIDLSKTACVVEGVSVKLKRVLPVRKHRGLNPFLRVDHFLIEKGGFPNQIHNGFEGLFYLFSGTIHHEDSMGNYFDIKAGGGELFTAGAGLIHKEMVDDKAHGIRIWLDLPAEKKHMTPLYQRFEASDLPLKRSESVHVRTVLGEGSSVETQLNVEMFDVSLRGKSVYKYDIPESFNGFVYVVVGSVKIRGKVVNASETVYFKNEKDVAILSNHGARILVCFGEPHHDTFHHAQSYETV